MKPQITFDEFLEIDSKVEITIGQITEAELVPKSYGLKLTVNFGGGDVRTVFTNIGKTHTPDQLIGLKVPFITNLPPIVIKGVNSQAMIMVGLSVESQIQVGLDAIEIGSKLM